MIVPDLLSFLLGGSDPSGDRRLQFGSRLGAFTLDAGISRQLQYPGSLADDEIRYLHDHPVRKFERIMMLGWPVHVDLSEARKVVADIPAEYRSFHPYVRLEGDLGPRAEADRDCSIVGGRKST